MGIGCSILHLKSRLPITQAPPAASVRPALQGSDPMAARIASAAPPPQPGAPAVSRPAGCEAGLGRLVIDRQLDSPRGLRLPGAQLVCVSRVRIYLAGEPAPATGGASGAGSVPASAVAQLPSAGAADPDTKVACADAAAPGRRAAGAARGGSQGAEEQQQVCPAPRALWGVCALRAAELCWAFCFLGGSCGKPQEPCACCQPSGALGRGPLICSLMPGWDAGRGRGQCV